MSKHKENGSQQWPVVYLGLKTSSDALGCPGDHRLRHTLAVYYGKLKKFAMSVIFTYKTERVENI